MIYCVEDDEKILNLMLYTLRASGFEAEGFDNSDSLKKAMENTDPQLIILDIMLPGKDGIEILQDIRCNPGTSKIPVIMASAKGTEYDKIMGLDLGADDYMAKPFGMMEMVSRVKAVLRRYDEINKIPVLKIGNLTLNTQKHTVISDNESVELTLKEFGLLELFMENPGMVFTRDQLLSKIWGDTYVGESRTIDVHIGTLRTKLGICGDYIKTIRGIGYKMEADNDKTNI